MTHTQNTPALDALFARMARWRDRPALLGRGELLTYGALLERVDRWDARLEAHAIGRGTVCGLSGEFSPESCALIVSLLRRGAIAVPFSASSAQQRPALMALAGIRFTVDFDVDDNARIAEHRADDNALVAEFRSLDHPGLILFTSGSSGRPKAILHDAERVVAKFAVERRGWRTLLFLMIDHFGGFNTLLSALAYGGVAVCVDDRGPAAVCRTIADARVELLPATPTFLRLLLTSGAWRTHDLSSVALVSYGAEPMPQSTLDKVRPIFPAARFKQTYGLSELGVLHSRSPQDDSTWLTLGGAGFETRVVDGVLWVRSASSMVGYLNAPTPFDADGWMNTGDEVEVRDGLIRFLGRKSEVINVGGQKVFPSEVEDVLMEASNVVDATVFGLAHPLLGQVPCARIVLASDEAADEVASRLRRHCAERVAKYKIPMRFTVETAPALSARMKKARDTDSAR